ncbi:MAG: hypothetical protein FJW23_12850 [Acidimicrobiia bacterium]|nr:hypothetical protein [Acidimicrobiia bacterium]
MTDHDSLAERGRALEEDYFRRKDRALIEKMREAAAREQARGELGRRTGLQDPALVEELQELGFAPDTVILLPLVPVLEMAWAEGGITAAERQLLVKLARGRGVQEGDAADRLLDQWMARRPDPQVFSRAGRLIAAMLATGGADEAQGGLTADDLVAYCEKVAEASGGVLGFIGRVSSEEKALLSRIASELKTRHT